MSLEQWYSDRKRNNNIKQIESVDFKSPAFDNSDDNINDEKEDTSIIDNDSGNAFSIHDNAENITKLVSQENEIVAEQDVSHLNQLQEMASYLEEAKEEIFKQSDELKNERQVLKDWEELLKDQQRVINEWNPDNTPPKERIINLLEQNPEVLHDIIQVIESLRKRNPGLDTSGVT